VGSILRVAGGVAFLLTLFLPTVRGCGREYTQVQIAGDQGSAAGLALVAGAGAFAVLAFLGPIVSKKPRRWAEGFVMIAALAFAAVTVVFVDRVIQKGGKILWAIGAQAAALALVFVGALLRFREAGRRR
jgi:hypothetical protein